MQKRGRLPAKRLVQLHVLGRADDPLLGADDVRDPHQVIVDDVGQVIGRKAIGLEQHLIVDGAVVDHDVAAQAVVKARLTGLGHGQADDVLVAARDALLRFGLRNVAIATIVAGRLALGHTRAAHDFQLLGRGKARIRGAAVDQLLTVFLIDRRALGLPIWTAATLGVGAFVPLQTQPAQRPHNRVLTGARRASLVGVLDAQDELAAKLFGKDIVKQRDVGGTDVRVTGWRRRNTHAHRLFVSQTGKARSVGVGT